MGTCVTNRQRLQKLPQLDHFDNAQTDSKISQNDKHLNPQIKKYQNQTDQLITSLFEKYDRNHSNFLQLDELVSMMKDLTVFTKTKNSVTRNDVEILLRSCNCKHPNKLSKDQFKAYYYSLI